MNFKKSSKILFCLVLTVLFATGSAFAHGKKDVSEVDTNNLESWQESFDLSRRLKGKYNIMVTATDMGGNTVVEGPYNIKVDPKSDLPVCSITNPRRDMRVIGNLNIVGACIDDDAVSYVELILDGDKEHPIRAQGKEFWSYYLDTTQLEEGLHTIEVVGYDIYGLRGYPTVLGWNLDRRQPITKVDDPTMGALVSGSVKLKGMVEDGNGIKSLSYSLDGGRYFYDVKLKNKKTYKEFEINVNTKNFEDGAQVIWFKAVDNSGSEGIYSFLYFVDNTKPEVKIVAPDEKEQNSGKFIISGYAKDTMGIDKLTYEWGTEKGEFELIPGNPFWSLPVNVTGSKDKKRTFTITAHDIAGNIVTVSKKVLINEELNKPVVTVVDPNPQTFVEADDPLFVRGYAHDREGVAKIKYRLDAGEWLEEESNSSFYGVLAKGSDLSAGKHTVTVIAVDACGAESNPVVAEFAARGAKPQFADAKIVGGRSNGQAAYPGFKVHPEEGAAFQVGISSSVGITAIHTVITGGRGATIENDIPVKEGTSSIPVSIPITRELPQGILRIVITATDSLGRTVDYRTYLNVQNLTVAPDVAPAVVIKDCASGENNLIVNNKNVPNTMHFVGGTARTVEIVPATQFAKASVKNNIITLTAGSAVGISDPVVIRVTTDQGLTYDSEKVVFRYDGEKPVVRINGASETSAIDGSAGKVTIAGSISSEGPLSSVSYKVYTAKAVMAGDVVNSLEAVKAGEAVSLGTSRSFSFPFDATSEENGYGIYIIEVTAVGLSGEPVAASVAVRNIPETTGVAKAPMFVWADGTNVTYAVAYQGEVDKTFGVFKRSEMVAGTNTINVSVTTPADGKQYPSKLNTTKTAKIDGRIISVGDASYGSGMTVTMEQSESTVLIAEVETDANVTGANYEISGDNIPGGTNTSNGVAKVTKQEGSNKWTIEVPLANLPVRYNNIKITVKAGSVSKEIKGTVLVVRSVESRMIDDRKTVYALEGTGSMYDKDSASYVMTTGSIVNFYANVPGVKGNPTLVGGGDALALEVNETNPNSMAVRVQKDGTFQGIQIRMQDSNGVSYQSQPITIISDSGAPEVKIVTPELHTWARNSVRITGTAADPSGIKSAEYSVDGGNTWKSLAVSGPKTGITFSGTEDLKNIEDGLVCLEVRVTDVAGNAGYAHTSFAKDTVPPTVEVVVPTEESIVNGENLIAFRVEDNGAFAKAIYVGPPSRSERVRTEIKDADGISNNPYVMVHVGTKQYPMDEAMSFEFLDAAGNVTTIDAWKFIIDTKSDLPVAEIHLPVDNEVITRDFTISGVVYDDDGKCEIYYRIDKGEYTKLPEMATSFAIPVDFSTLLDNEHTLSIYAVDINGVRGPVVDRRFRVSTEEPKGSVEKPTLDDACKEVVTISGVASDKNGIDKVLVSLDNGNSYNLATGTTEWTYTFDTRAITDGTNVVFIKVIDKYGINGLYSSLINIDNQKPEMILDYPVDDSTTYGPLFFSGYAFDNVGITEMYASITSLEGKEVPGRMRKVNFELERIISNTLDLSSLNNGNYNVEVTARDKAGNTTHLSRNITLNKNKPLATVDLLYPLNGESKHGVFNIYGQASSDTSIETLSLYVDGKFISDTKLSQTGYFTFKMGPESISEGMHTYRVDARVEGGTVIRSRTQSIEYSPVGPWVTIDNFAYGDFATNRPFIQGHAGYSLDEEELIRSKMKSATKEDKAIVAEKKVEKVEVSFDNGKSFETVSKAEKWMYRVENQDIAEGYHFMLIRATMKNKETAIERCIIQIDNTSPSVRLISPVAGGAYNQELVFSGLSTDDVGLKSVKMSLRKGDKSSYEVPSFIQGLYLDWNFWGATLFDIGAGLTFFDNAVKVQFQWGQFTSEQRDAVNTFLGRELTEMRYGGDNVMGLKILANIGELPFAFLFGRDFEALSATLAVGANFTYFNQTNSGRGQILSALITQVEFPRLHFNNLKMFSTFSFYYEGSLWFIPTDIASDTGVDIKNMVWQNSIGFRLNVF